MSNMTANQCVLSLSALEGPLILMHPPRRLELHAENKHGKKLADCFPGKVA